MGLIEPCLFVLFSRMPKVGFGRLSHSLIFFQLGVSNDMFTEQRSRLLVGAKGGVDSKP